MVETADRHSESLRKLRRRSTLIVVVLCLCVPSVAKAAQRPAQNSPRAIPANFAPTEILWQVLHLRQQRDSALRQGDAPDALDQFVAGLWQGLGLPDKWKGRCESCGFLLVEEDLGYVVLRMEVESWEYRLLVFDVRGASNTWRIAGYADTFSKYRTPTTRIENESHGEYLVVVYSTGGTGALDAGETWYELSPGSSREVLSYTTEGHDTPFLQGKGYFLGREWESRPVRALVGQDSTVDIQLTVKYFVGDDKGIVDLVSKKDTAVFRWDVASRTYKFDEKASAMTRVEFDAVYGFPRSDLQTLVKYNFDALRQIAEQGTAARKALLRLMLTDAGADPQAADLLRRIR